MSIEWEINLDLERVSAAADTGAPIGAGKAMEHIRGVATALTPEDTGHLISTADVQVNGNDATITFDGPYARRQHEELTWRHEKGQAKYLEQPMHTEKDTALGIVAKEIRNAL